VVQEDKRAGVRGKTESGVRISGFGERWKEKKPQSDKGTKKYKEYLGTDKSG
jgi:hypothetical protein